MLLYYYFFPNWKMLENLKANGKDPDENKDPERVEGDAI